MKYALRYKDNPDNFVAIDYASGGYTYAVKVHEAKFSDKPTFFDIYMVQEPNKYELVTVSFLVERV